MENQNGSDIDEKNLDEELAGHGIIEVGMSLQDKRELLAVFKASESSAIEEENYRVDELNKSSSVQVFDLEEDDYLLKPDISSCQNDEKFIESVSLFSSPKSSRNFNKEETNVDTNKSSPVPNFCNFSLRIPRLSLKSDKSVKISESEGTNQPEMISTSNKSSLVLRMSEDDEIPDVVQYHADSEDTLKTSQPLSQHKALFKEDKKHYIDDKKRNIDVFNCEGSTVDLVVRKQQNVNGKPSFYFVPRGMNLNDFTAYFKQQLDTMAHQLILTQRKSLNLVQWGDPVVVSYVGNKDRPTTPESNSKQITEDKLPPVSQNQRYNFRGRSSKRKCTDDIFQYFSEEESSGDELFVKRDKKTNSKTSGSPYSSVTKRKSLFSVLGDHLEEIGLNDSSGQNVKNGDSSSKILHVSSENEITVHDQNTEDDSQNQSRLTILKELASCSTNDNVSSSEKLMLTINDDNDQESSHNSTNVAIAITNIPSTGKWKKGKNLSTKNVAPLVGVGESTGSLWLNTMTLDGYQGEDIVIKPGLCAVRKKASGRKRAQKSQKSSVHEVDNKLDDIESEERDQMTVDLVACPICKEMFKGNEVEAHAADCTSEASEEVSVQCPMCDANLPSDSVLCNHIKHCTAQRRVVPPPHPTSRKRNRRSDAK